MGQRNNEPGFSDDIDEFFEPILGAAIEEQLDAEESMALGKNRLAELRRRAELRLEEKRMREELDYMDLDGEDA